MHKWSTLSSTFVFLMCAVLCGCAEVSKHPEPPPMPVDPVAWPYGPTSVRVHPTTRFVYDETSGKFLLEARIEFRDRDQIVTRCWGNVRIALHDATLGDLLSSFRDSWQIDLHQQESNAAHFDDLTRTYVFRLQLTDQDAVGKANVRVHYRGADGAGLDASGDVRLPREIH